MCIVQITVTAQYAYILHHNFDISRQHKATFTTTKTCHSWRSTRNLHSNV